MIYGYPPPLNAQSKSVVSINARSFIFDIIEGVTKAPTYLALLAIEGNDKNWEKVLPYQNKLVEQFREKAHHYNLTSEDGVMPEMTRTNLCSFLLESGHKIDFDAVNETIAKTTRNNTNTENIDEYINRITDKHRVTEKDFDDLLRRLGVDLPPKEKSTKPTSAAIPSWLDKIINKKSSFVGRE